MEGVPKEKKSTAMGFYQAVYGIGITLGPVLMGAVGLLMNISRRRIG